MQFLEIACGPLKLSSWPTIGAWPIVWKPLFQNIKKSWKKSKPLKSSHQKQQNKRTIFKILYKIIYGNPCAIIACPIDENQLLAFIHLNKKQNNDEQLKSQ